MAAYQLNKQSKAYVLVTLIGVSGSTPRNSGTKMVIARDKIFDTIGGGHLEHKVIKFARKLLSENKECQHLEHFQLGIHLDQCCGGSANVLFECFPAIDVNIMLFGAGHVGQALLPILASLPCQISWVDSRKQQFPQTTHNFHNVSRIVSANPENEVINMPANSYYIVMTHKHQMDFDISHQIFKRGDFNYLGLIGSKTKWHRFQQRFEQREIDERLLERMNCPIGLADVPGKSPAEVAVSVAAEIIGRYQQKKQEFGINNKQGVHWKLLTSLSKKDQLKDNRLQEKQSTINNE